MPKVIICDRCGRTTKDDYKFHSRIFRHKCKWEKFDLVPLVFGAYENCIYLCKDCVDSFNEWMTEEA